MSRYRQHGRKVVKLVVKLSHKEFGELYVETRDVSETGIFVDNGDLADQLDVGQVIKGFFYNEKFEGASKAMTVVRTTDDGVALTY